MTADLAARIHINQDIDDGFNFGDGSRLRIRWLDASIGPRLARIFWRIDRIVRHAEDNRRRRLDCFGAFYAFICQRAPNRHLIVMSRPRRR